MGRGTVVAIYLICVRARIHLYKINVHTQRKKKMDPIYTPGTTTPLSHTAIDKTTAAVIAVTSVVIVMFLVGLGTCLYSNWCGKRSSRTDANVGAAPASIAASSGGL